MKTINHSRCNARGCFKNIRHDKLFCCGHWLKIPYGIKSSLVEYYVIGQDDPASQIQATNTWLHVVAEAIDCIERLERTSIYD